MPADIFHDPFLCQFSKLSGPELYDGSSPGRCSSSDLDHLLLRAQLQDLDLSEIHQDALCDFNIRKKLGSDATDSLDSVGGRSSLLPDAEMGRTAAVFNNASWDKKIRFVMNEILRVHHLVTLAPLSAKTSNKFEWRTYPSEFFSASSCIMNVAEILAFLLDRFDDILPLNVVCQTALRMPHGLWILGRILLPHVHLVPDVCEFLMQQCSGDDINDGASSFYGKVILYLIHVFPSCSPHIRHLAISQQKFFNLLLCVTLQWQKRLASPAGFDHAIVDLWNQLFISAKEDFRIWSSSNAHLAGTKGLASFEECRLQLLIHAYKLLPTNTLGLTSAQIVDVIRVMRLYIQLKEVAELSLTTEEYRVLSKLVMCRPTALSTLSNQFLILGLCCFTLLPDMLVDHAVECEFVDWIKWQLDVDIPALDAAVPEGGTHLEILLLLASHLRGSHYKNISELVSDCLGFKTSVKSNSTVRMKNLLNNEIFRDEALLRHTLRVPPTHNLNAAFITALPVNCIHSLLQNKIFTSYDSLIKDWILAQIRKCTTPVHPVMIQVVALYIERTLPFLKKMPDGTEEYISLQKPFRATEICSIIYDIPEPTKMQMKNLRTLDLFIGGGAETTGQVHVSKILAAFYVLAFNHHYQNHLKAYMTARLLNYQPYGMEILGKIPFRHYLALTLRDREIYDPLGDVLGRLMLEVLPQMRTVYDDMQSSFVEDETTALVQSAPASGDTTVPSVTQPVSRFLDLLSRCSINCLSTCIDDFIALVPRMWIENLPRTTQDAFEKVWSRLAAVDSNTVFFTITCSFLTLGDKSTIQITPEDLCFEPLHILRCDDRIFQMGFLTRILLRIFTSHLAASRIYLTNQLEIVEEQTMLKKNLDSLNPVREEQKRAMFMLQESLAVQILIEKCVLPGSAGSEFGLPTVLTESQTAICTFIHRMILANPTLAKLVIFQGFPLEAVPVIVRGVESLHICFDYLHEAMDLPLMTKKLFVLELTSCLCLRFRINRTLIVARLAVDVIGTMVIAYPQAVQPDVVRVGARCLARIGSVFPPLRDDCLAVLDQMKANVRSNQMASRQWKGKSRALLSAVPSPQQPANIPALLHLATKCASDNLLSTSQND